MPSSTEPRSGLFYGWSLGESGWNVQMDSNLKRIGRFGFHLSIKDRDLTAPPGSPTAGDTYIVKANRYRRLGRQGNSSSSVGWCGLGVWRTAHRLGCFH